MPRPFKYREAVLSLLKDNPIHPTVDWIHGQLRRNHPRVSLATVYRTLKTLVAEGTLCELPFGTSESRFGLTLEQKHYHFICERCHKIYDLPTRPRMALEQSVQTETGHRVSRHTMEFYGLCRECAAGRVPRTSAKRPPKRKEKTR
jgi:Fur family peroxide stress response transcriptional regulator